MADPIEIKKRNAQELHARGAISAKDYAVLGKANGFVPKSTGEKAAKIASISGYVVVGLGAAAEIASVVKPELRGPLTDILSFVKTILGFAF